MDVSVESLNPSEANATVAAPPLPSGETPALATEPALAPAPAQLPHSRLAEPLLRLSLACVATFGLYLALHVARLGGQLGNPPQKRRWPWGLAVFFPPAACALLHQVPRLARAALPETASVSRPTSWLAPALYAGLYLGSLIGPLASLMAPLVFLLPLPFVIMQAQLNQVVRAQLNQPMRLDPAGAITVPPRNRRRWLWLAFLPIAGLLLYRLDHMELRGLADNTPVEKGSTVVDAVDGRFSLIVPSDGWHRVPPASLVEDDPEMGFRHNASGDVLVTRSRPVNEKGGLDDLVAGRREAIGEAGKILSISEKRVFLSGAEFVPVSIARYVTRSMGVNNMSFHVASVVLAGRGIEVIGIGHGHEDDDPLAVFVSSIAARPQAEHEKVAP
ncbi:MAG TPA: hypothetical protein VGF45_00520 [Polyangia bacterium]